MRSPTLTKGFNTTESIIAKTMEYLSIPSVVGHEQIFMDHLYEDFKSLNLSVTRRDGLLEISGKEPDSAIVCAHIDRHGLISIGNNEYAYAAQYMREIKYGEENRHSRKELLDIAERFEVERLNAYDSQTGFRLGEELIKTSRKALNNGDSIFLIDGLEEIEPDTPLAYARMAEAENGFLKGQIDNTISIGVIHALFKRGYQGTALLTTEEEIGKSWIHIAKHLEEQKIETQELIVIDTSPYISEAPLDDGAIILRTRDRFTHFNTALTQRLEKRCVELDIPYRIKDQVLLENGKEIDDLGSTELGRLTKEKERRWGGTTVQVPTNMYHTSAETTSYLAVENYYKFLRDLLVKNSIEFDIKRG